MISKSIRKSIGIFGIAMGLVASPLAFSETFISPSMYSDPINDTRHITRPAFPNHAMANNPSDLATLSPSFKSDPIRDSKDITRPAWSFNGTQGASIKLASPSMKSDPINDPFSRRENC